MRLAALLLMLPVVGLAQEESADNALQEALENNPIRVQEISEGDPRATTQQVLITLYRSEEVRAQCLRTPDKPINVTLNGYKVPLECTIWNRWHAAEQERLREQAEAAAP